MSKAGSYRTIEKSAEGFYREKGSKFTAYAFPCSDEEEAKGIIARLRKENPSARHVCFAWRFGTDRYHDRFSDDGEPNNSAGKPIFGQILAFDLTNVLIAVVRIFGGTKLGVGGLVRAYKTAAEDALQQAKIIERSVCNYYRLTFPAEETGKAMQILSASDAQILEHGFDGNDPNITFSIPLARVDSILNAFESTHLFELNFIKTE